MRANKTIERGEGVFKGGTIMRGLSLASSVRIGAFCAALLLAASAWAGDGAAWEALSPAEQQALAPLQANWGQMKEPAKNRWRKVAQAYGQANPAVQARMQAHMRDWASMSPQERHEARQNFQALHPSGGPTPQPGVRMQRWQEYQRLSPEQKQQWRQRAGRR